MAVLESLDDFCGSKFWDLNRTWYTENPDFTRCFEDTALVWTPCGFLVLVAAADVYFSLNTRARTRPWSLLNIAKSSLCVLLIICQAYHLAHAISQRSQDEEQIFPVHIYTPVIKICTFILAAFLLQLSRRGGVASSLIQFVFWLLFLICELFTFQTILREFNPDENSSFSFVIHIIYFPMVLCQFLFHCWAEKPARTPKKLLLADGGAAEQTSPEHESSILSRLTFSWFDPIAWKGYRAPLQYSDLWNLNRDDLSHELVPDFDRAWGKCLEKSRKKEGKNFKNSQKKKIVSIAPALISSFGLHFSFAALLKLVPDLLAFASPELLRLLIAFVRDPNDPVWRGYFYATLLVITALVQSMFTGQYSHRVYMVGMKIRTVLVSAIYRKALVVSNASRKELTVGEIVNLMSVDVQRVMDTMPVANLIWSAPLQIGLALYFLWQQLGPSVLAGLGVMVILIPLNAVIATKVRAAQLIQMQLKDSRVKMVNEILSGIKVLKLMAWEESFQDQVMRIRDQEMQTLRRAALLNALVYFLWSCAPFLVAACTFITYVLIDDNNILDPEKTFVSLSLFNIMNFPLGFLPMIISAFTQGVVSIGRLNKYMNADELDASAVSHDDAEDPIVIEQGNFAWEKDTIVLKDINLRVKEGSLVAVVGTVGCGKSSLLYAMLGELQKNSGHVNTRGDKPIGYVSQQAWIQNATVRENITFGRAHDPTTYNMVIQACALKHDLDILPGGDQTEIGEKGINLSGGQKQRVALARAVYNDADVYLFDDPLSAVDAHVGKHIFDNILGPRGLLRKKTRVLVTHGISFLHQVDNIVVLKDGRISEVGTYKELLEKRGAFAEFLLQHITEDSEDIEDPTVLSDIEGVIGPLDSLRRAHKNSVGNRGGSLVSSSEDGPFRGDRRNSKKLSGTKVTGDRRSLRRESLQMEKEMEKKHKIIEVEKTETQSVKWSVYLDYFGKAGRFMSIGTFVFYLIFQGFAVGSNLWLTEWTVAPLVNGTLPTEDRNKYLGVYAALGLSQGIFIFLGTTFLAIGTLKSASKFHSNMLHRILKCPMHFFDVTPIGRIVNRFAKDVDVADNILPQFIRLWLNSFFQVLATIFIISYSTPIFLTIVVPVGGLYYLIQRFYVSTSRQLKRLESVTRSPIYSHFGETVTGAPTIRAYREQDRFIVESESRVDHNQKSYYPAMISNRWLAVRLETVGNTIIFFAAFFAVLGKDTLSSGLVGLSVTYALQITMGLNLLVRWTSDVETNIVAIERLQEYMDAPQEKAWEIVDTKPDSSWPQNGVVIFDDYQARYRDGLDLVLKGVSCKILGGQKIGIIGRTGAGKSSLTLGFFRIFESAGGSILIDGLDISSLGLHDVRARLTIIPQEPVLFSGTLRANLDPFNEYSDDTVFRALELAHLKPLVQGFSRGLDHEISEGGDNLSIGQRQLVCLARALLRKTKILILDEATAAVDLETDDLIQETIRREFADSTVLTIAHRLNTIMDSTKIMVMDNGVVREFDSPQRLLQNPNTLFSDMVRDAGLGFSVGHPIATPIPEFGGEDDSNYETS